MGGPQYRFRGRRIDAKDLAVIDEKLEFETNFKETNTVLARFLTKTGVPMDHVEDICQITWKKAWGGRDQFREESSFRTWIVQIARHCWPEVARTPKHKLTEQLPPYLERPVPGKSVLDVLMENEIVARTPPLLRQHYLEEMSIEEVAAKHGVTLQCMKTRLHRELLKFRVEIKSIGFKLEFKVDEQQNR